MPTHPCEISPTCSSVLKGCPKFSLKHFLLQVEQPHLSQPVFRGEVLQPSHDLNGPPVDVLQQLHVLLVLRTPRAGCGTPSAVSWEWSRWVKSPPSTCWPLFFMQPKVHLAFWALSEHCWVMLSFLSANTPSLYLRTALKPFSAQSIFALDPRAGPWTWPCWCSWSSHGNKITLFSLGKEEENTRKETLLWLYILGPKWQKKTIKAKPCKQAELPNVT